MRYPHGWYSRDTGAKGKRGKGEDRPPGLFTAAGFTLTVWNGGNDQVRVWHGEQEIGIVEAHSQTRFGPFAGSWRDTEGIVIRGPGDREWPVGPLGIKLNHDLGEIPNVEVAVSGG